jgi:hypothetical protein
MAEQPQKSEDDEPREAPIDDPDTGEDEPADDDRPDSEHDASVT